MKSIKAKFNLREIAARFPSFLRARFGAILLVVFLSAIAAWALIFWRYGLEVSGAEPDVELKIVKIKENDLRGVLDDIKARESAQSDVMNKTIPNPFIKPSEAQ